MLFPARLHRMTKLSAHSLVTIVFLILVPSLQSSPTPKAVPTFTQRYCVECHDSDTKKAGLDLTALPFEPKAHDNFAKWVQILDRVSTGEMPPKKKSRPLATDLPAFTNSLSTPLLLV